MANSMFRSHSLLIRATNGKNFCMKSLTHNSTKRGFDFPQFTADHHQHIFMDKKSN